MTAQICAPALPWKRRRRRRCGATCWSAWRARGWWGWCTSTSSTSPAGTAGCGEWSACDWNMTGFYNYRYIETLFLRWRAPPPPPRPGPNAPQKEKKIWWGNGWSHGQGVLWCANQKGGRIYGSVIECWTCWLEGQGFELRAGVAGGFSSTELTFCADSLFWCLFHPSLYFGVCSILVLQPWYFSICFAPELLQWYVGICSTPHVTAVVFWYLSNPELLQWYVGICSTPHVTAVVFWYLFNPELLQWYVSICSTPHVTAVVFWYLSNPELLQWHVKDPGHSA